MSQFSYKARDNRGEMLTGILQATSLEEAGRRLRGEGKFVVDLKPARDGAAARKRDPRRIRVNRADVASFTHQLAVMVDTGVPLSEALQAATDQTADENFRAVLEDVCQQVQAGNALSATLARYPRTFPPVMISLLRASEASGSMGPMLERLAKHLEKELATRRKIRGALTYPGVMMVMVLGVTLFLLTFVMPRFVGIYDTRGVTLPWATAFLMDASHSLMHYWYYYLIGLIAVTVGLVSFGQTTPGRYTYDWLKLHTPVIGPLFHKVYLARGCQTMGTLINAGVPVLDMIEITRETTRNVYFDRLWKDIDDRLRRGVQLSEAMMDSPLVPRSVSQMIFAGEKSGRLGRVMERVATFTEEAFDEQIAQSTRYIEPAMIIVMGAIIGFVAIAMLLPIFQLSSVVAG
ncbi:type II secretion system F family protein [Phycisphaerales bacterium AB-hyl4]|uniref:General secretion pathway protein F n=1 Tax=Natronomicrosphaera hydrolytica TaxID=3242702 RepID=A0ABV4TZV8_9BACT